MLHSLRNARWLSAASCAALIACTPLPADELKPAAPQTVPVADAVEPNTPAPVTPVTPVSPVAPEAPATAPVTTEAAAPAATESAKIAPAQTLLVEGKDAPTIARELVRTFMTDAEFTEELTKVRSRIEDFEKEVGGEPGRFLNDRLVIHGLNASNGKIEKVQKGIVWLAFYKELRLNPPQAVENFMKVNRDALIALFGDFSWEKAGAFIRNREWKKPSEALEANDKKGAAAPADNEHTKTAARS